MASSRSLRSIVEKVASDAAIKGAVVTSGKDTFCGGADLTMLERIGAIFADMVAQRGRGGRRAHGVRGKPQALAALSAAGNLRQALGRRHQRHRHGRRLRARLACHHRVAADNPKTRLGLPEVQVGLFPGAGGTQRVARMLPPADALQFLLKGDQLKSTAPRR